MAKNGQARKGRGRRTPKTAPEDQVETRKPTPNRLPFDQQDEKKKRRFNEIVANIKGYNAKIASINGQRRKQLEVAKNENFNTKAISDTARLAAKDPFEMREYFEQYSFGMEQEGLPIKLQIGDASFDDPVAQARSEAAQACKHGRTPECRWPEGSPEHKAYWAVYHAEQAKLTPGADKLTEAERKEAARVH